MASRYWVAGGDGNWSSATNWSATSGGASGATVPGSSDAAFFDANSGSGTATLDSSVTIQTLTMTGFTGTLAFGTNTISLNSTGAIFTGSLTCTITGTPLIISTTTSSSTRTIAAAAVTEANSISFRFTGGTGLITMPGSSVSGLDFTDGVNATGFGGTLNSNAITVYGDLKLSTNMVAPTGAAGIAFRASSGTQKITTAGKTIDRNLSFGAAGFTAIHEFQDALTQGATRTFTVTAGTVKLKDSVTNTVGSFLTTGTDQKYLQSTSAGTQATLSQASGTVNASYLTIQDINAAGGATWNAYVDQSNVDAGNNDGWDFGVSPVVGGAEYTYQLRSFTEPRRF